MANRLAGETSPYLLQHAHNPVDWYPWGDEAFERARAEDKPVLLSVGYSACHWCHVMERESFEDLEIARQMNEGFVNIKVDREERPDVDAVYMNAVQALTGRGGWPMTVFLTPDGRPFWGGTYFPPEDRQGMPGFPRILTGMAKAYQEDRAAVEGQAGKITEHLREAGAVRAPGDLAPELLEHAARALAQTFDARNGGFGGAPKFPPAMTLDFLLRWWTRTGDENARQIVAVTLDKMAHGGIYDHLGGGFHRYAVDAIWLVPHFEKMLYDNALLARVYLHAYQATDNPEYRRIVEETLDYVIREMTDPAGGFYSTQDADSEGEEGKFFVWTPAEVEAVVGPAAAPLFNAAYDVTAHGNFEHANVLSLPRELSLVAAEQGIDLAALQASLAESRRMLFEARESRVHPARDDKVLAGWNGMMLRAIAEAAAVLDRDDYRAVAVGNAEFLTGAMLRDGRVLRSWKDGAARIDGYLEDYALLADGLIGVHELTFDARWLESARDLAERLIALFWDDEIGGFYDTAHDTTEAARGPRLPVRPRDPLDNATPAGSSVAVSVLLRLGVLLGREDYTRRAATVLGSLRESFARYPSAFGELLQALDFHLSTPMEVAVVGPREDPATQALLHEVYRRYIPNKVIAGRAPDDARLSRLSPLMEARDARGGLPTAYVCESYACQAPTSDPAELGRQLDHALAGLETRGL